MCTRLLPIPRFGSFSDDETTKQIWEELSQIYTTCHAQTVIRLERELEGLSFAHIADWKAYLNSFLEIIVKLAAHGTFLTDADKQPKRMRTLPDSLAPIAMHANTNNLTIDQLVDGVAAELLLRKHSLARET